jgi:hypothetical protein
MQLVEKEINGKICRVAHVDLKKFNKHHVKDLLIKMNMYFDYVIVYIYSNTKTRFSRHYRINQRILLDNSFCIINNNIVTTTSSDTLIFRYENSDQYKQNLRRKKLERLVYE